MSEWRECKIGDVVLSANTGLDAIKRAPIVDKDTGIKCLRIQDVSQEKKYEDWGFTEVEPRNFDKFQLKKNDIIVARTGASIGVNKIIKEDLNSVLNNGLIRIRANEKLCDSKYLFFNFRTSNYNAFIESISGGTSTQPNMQINALLSYDISLPPLPEQKAIAAVLSSLDDKIDLLHRQNKTLEVMAEMLFKQWFVVEAREDWEEKPLNYFFEISSGKGLKKEQLTENGIYPVLGANGEIGRTNDYLFDEKLLFTGRVGTLGNIFIVDNKKVWLSDNTLVFRKIQYFYFIYFVLKFARLADYNAGSTQPLIRQSDIKEITISFPCKEKLDFFENQSENFFRKIHSNNKQIQTLETLRDNLLPKLISGDIRIKKEVVFQ
jgi:type I restriction enzyme S subunit